MHLVSSWLFSCNKPPPQNFPAWCLYHPQMTWGRDEFKSTDTNQRPDTWVYNWFYVVFTVGLLIYSFCTRLILLSNNISLSHHVLRAPKGQPWDFMESMICLIQNWKPCHPRSRVGKAVSTKFLRSIYAVVIVFHDLYSSKIWEVSFIPCY